MNLPLKEDISNLRGIFILQPRVPASNLFGVNVTSESCLMRASDARI